MLKEFGPGVVSDLIDLFGDGNPRTADLASDTLVDIGQPAIALLADRLFRDPNATIRRQCAVTLGRMKDTALALPALRQAATGDSDSTVHDAANVAIRAIDAAVAAKPPSDPILLAAFNGNFSVTSGEGDADRSISLRNGAGTLDGVPVHLNVDAQPLKPAKGSKLAAVVLSAGPEADGTSRDIVAVGDPSASTSTTVTSVLLGHGVRVQSMSRAEGQVVVACLAPRPCDAPCCPSEKQTIRFRVLNSTLVRVLARPVPGGGPST